MKQLGCARLVVLFLVLSLAACESSSGAPAPGDDAGSEPGPYDAGVCPEQAAFETGSATGHADPLHASATEARAGRIRIDQLPRDPDGLATWAGNDFVLANDRIALVIEDVGDSDIYDPWGGKIVGTARVRDGALVDPADFEEVLAGIGFHTVQTTSVTVLHDGSDGHAAVIRAVGTLTAVPTLAGLQSLFNPRNYDGLPVALDYTLEPGAEVVDITMTIASSRPLMTRLPFTVHGFLQHNRMPAWAPRFGFDLGTSGDAPYIAFVRDDRGTYAWWSPTGPLTPILADQGASLFSAAPQMLAPCATTALPLARIAVGGPGLDAIQQVVARVRGSSLREISGRVTDAEAHGVAGAHVHATTPMGDHLTYATTDATGAYSLHIPADAAAKVLVFRAGEELSGAVDVPVSESHASFSLAARGTLHVVAREPGTHAPLPIRLQVTPVRTAADPWVFPPDSFGERDLGRGRVVLDYPTTGEESVTLQAGTYRVVATHGYEYELFDRMVEIRSGETTEVLAELEHVVDTDGVMCGDFHIHTFRSLDSADHARVKVASAVGDGVEVLARSDHEWVNGFEPVIAELGVGDFAFGVNSDELSTTGLGHFGIVPATPDPSLPNFGSPRWHFRPMPEVFAEVRARPEHPAIIINHPRETLLGYFEDVGLDVATNMVRHPEQWDDSFGLIEVFNHTDFASNRDTTVKDWFAFLNAGARKFAVGSSDSHRVDTVPVGYPRTCMTFGTDDPRALTESRVRDVLSSGASFISGGIYITAQGPGAGPGQEASGVGALATIDVRVQAASWVDVQRLLVFADGVLLQTVAVGASTDGSATRFHDNVSVPVANTVQGSWVVFVAEGDMPLSPAFGDRPFAVTNPIFLKR